MTLNDVREKYPRAELNLFTKDADGKCWQYTGWAWLHSEIEGFDHHETDYGEWCNVYMKEA